MATSEMPDEFFEEIEPLLPEMPRMSGAGGRPRKSHRITMQVIWFVLTSGVRWEDVPKALGCSGRTAHRRLQAWEELGIWDKIHMRFLEQLKQSGKLDLDTVVVDSVTLRAFGGGDQTGPSPVDRGRKGSKHTVLVDANGVPLEIRLAPANASDQTEIIPVVREYLHDTEAADSPVEQPKHLYADRGYDSNPTRAWLQLLGIEPHIAKRRVEHGSELGKIRWVVERMISWIKGLRRMRVRYDRLGIIKAAWSTLAIAVICFRIACPDFSPALVTRFTTGTALTPTTAVFQWGGRLTLGSVRDGATFTIMFGEKAVPQSHQGFNGGGLASLPGAAWHSKTPAMVGDGDMFDALSESNFLRSTGNNGLTLDDGTSPSGYCWTRWGSPHREVVQFGMCDGSVRSIGKRVDAANIGFLCTRSGSDMIDEAALGQN